MNAKNTLLFLHKLSERDRRKLEVSMFPKQRHEYKTIDSVAGANLSTKDLLRFDGMYAFQKGRSFDYLIFKRNGKVYGVPTTSTPNQVASWIHEKEDSEVIGKGTYKFSDPSHIAFTLRYDPGRVVEYSGTIEKDRLILDINDLYIDEKTMGRVFLFKEVEAWRKEQEKKGFFNRLFGR